MHCDFLNDISSFNYIQTALTVFGCNHKVPGLLLTAPYASHKQYESWVLLHVAEFYAVLKVGCIEHEQERC